MLFYRASLPLSRSTLEYVTGVISRHRRSINSEGRALPAGRQALMKLTYLKRAETFAQLAAGFGVGTTTAWRSVNEAVMLLSARSLRLGRALANARREGPGYLVLDRTLVPIDRLPADTPFYSGKHKKHGMNIQVIAGPEASCGCRGHCPARSTTEGGRDLGHHPRTGRLVRPGDLGDWFAWSPAAQAAVWHVR